ncbi:septum formation initiator family protein [Candidatus Jorgensenbacteria bacterium]|nr:septum formation initiator family protein [Candidatus Jorgensenbacteria bacterium]
MKFTHILSLLIVVGILGWGLYTLTTEKTALETEVNHLENSVKKLDTENITLRTDIDRLKQPENLLKELKSQFNYREDGEKLIILVPATATRPTSTR